MSRASSTTTTTTTTIVWQRFSPRTTTPQSAVQLSDRARSMCQHQHQQPVTASGRRRGLRRSRSSLSVSRIDLSGMVYEAWHVDDCSWGRIDAEPEDFLKRPTPTRSRFRPEHEPGRARLKGYDKHRRVLAKPADDVHTWPPGSLDSSFSVGCLALSEQSIAIFSGV